MHRKWFPLSYPRGAQRRPFWAIIVRLWGKSCGTQRMYPLPCQTVQPYGSTRDWTKSAGMSMGCLLLTSNGQRSLIFTDHSAEGMLACKKSRKPNGDSFRVDIMSSLFVSYVYNITLFEPLVKYIRKLFLSFFMTDSAAKCEGLPDDRPCVAGRVMW